jgi:hypothetical protein
MQPPPIHKGCLWENPLPNDQKALEVFQRVQILYFEQAHLTMKKL